MAADRNGVVDYEDDIDIYQNPVVSSWLIQISCNATWNQFKKYDSLEPDLMNLRDLIQGVLGRPISEDLETLQRVRLLLIMCRLTDGENYTTRYADGQVLTPLEDVTKAFSDLLSPLPIALCKEGQLLQHEIQYQAVLTCCRQGDFENAESVFQRQCESEESLFDAQKEKIKKVLKSKTSSHPEIVENSFNALIKKIKAFLQKVMDCFEEPFIIKVLKAYMRDKDRREDLDDGSKSQESGLKMGQGLMKAMAADLDVSSDSGLCNADESTKLRPTLSAIRKKTINNLVHNCRTKRQGTQTEENGLHGGGMDSSDHENSPRSPRKRKVLESLRKARRNLEDTTEKLANDLNMNAEMSSPNQRLSSSPRESPTMKKFRYRKNLKRADRHQPDLEESSDSDSTPDESQSVLGGSPQHLPQSSRLRLSLQPTSPSTASSTRQSVISHWKRKGAWGQDETEEFYKAVKKYGIGNWALIKEKLCSNRSNVQMKDKWRTIIKNGDVNALACKFGKVKS
ncbi:hypothetical protein ScPMuIL_006515 [Solemya velum]